MEDYFTDINPISHLLAHAYRLQPNRISNFCGASLAMDNEYFGEYYLLGFVSGGLELHDSANVRFV